MRVNSNIFKAYDIRGVYPNELNEDVAAAIGYCFVKLEKTKKIIIGRDMRLSSNTIFQALADGANQAGAAVIDIGLVSTDATYFASGKLKMPAIMITASHNPSQWNGFKLTEASAVPFGEAGIKKLGKMVAKYKINKKTAKRKISKNNILPEYCKNVLNFIDQDKIKKLKIAVDAGNGMGGKILSEIYAKLPCEIIPLYFELDGSFPNHQPSPIESKNIVQLRKTVKQAKANFGMAFDGDADRVFFIDEKGGIINGASIVALLSKYFLERRRGEKIIYDLRCSHFIPELISARGGLPLVSRVGHSFIKATMKKTGAIFGGELSGHYYFRDNYCADSAMITAAIVTQIISQEKKSFSKIMKNYSKYFQIEETNSLVKDKQAKLKEIEKKYNSQKITKLDGLTVEFPDWWFNVRQSNTEPVLRLNLEAKTKKLMEEKRDKLLKLIRTN